MNDEVKTIKIELGDWLKNVGIVGLLQILRYKRKNNEILIEEGRFLEFDVSLLENFDKSYFEVFKRKNEKSLSIYKIINKKSRLETLKIELDNYTENSDKKEFLKGIENLNKDIEYIKSKVISNSYKSAYILANNLNIEEMIKKFSKVKISKKGLTSKEMEISIIQIENLLNVINYLESEDVYKYVMAKNIMYDIIQPFWSNVSFLLKTNNKEDMYKLYKKDFVAPTINFYNSDKTKYKYECFTCDNKIKKLGKPDSFDLTWITKMGADPSRKSSHFWNFYCDAYVCPICNLVYSCIPLGFNVLNGRGIFINNNIDIGMLNMCNIVKFKDEKDTDNIFQGIEYATYMSIVNYMEQKNIENLSYELENIQVIKFNSNNPTRPYSFSVLSKSIMEMIYKKRKIFNSLIKISVKITDKYYINLYDEVINRIYSGSNLFDLIDNLIRLHIKGGFKAIRVVRGILEINNSLLGGSSMYYKETEKYVGYGVNLRESYINKNSENKLSGITYKLMNSLKTKDIDKFIYTIVNSYMYVGSRVPIDISKALNNEDTFREIGYAFVLGLQSEDKKEGNDNE